jgi:hypothetical protein
MVLAIWRCWTPPFTRGRLVRVRHCPLAPRRRAKEPRALARYGVETVRLLEEGSDAFGGGGTGRRRHRHVVSPFSHSRRFGRGDLRNEVERLSDVVPTLLKKMPAEKALEEGLTRYMGLVVAKRGLKEAVRSIFEPGTDTYAYSRDRLTTAVTLLLDAAAKSGAIRSDFDPQDVLLAVAASPWAFVNDGDCEDRTLRMLRLVMDGLRYKAG